MGVYISGLKMPKDCETCPFWEGEVNGCPITHYFTIRRKGVDRPEWCPLLPVPDHGDLIDRDALMARYAEEIKPSNNSDFMRPPRWNDAVQLTELAPVVIPAERSEE